MTNTLTIVAVLLSNVIFQPVQLTQSQPVYVALGDSIAAGVGSSLPRERSYPAQLGLLMSQELQQPVDVRNLAQPGESAASFLTGGQLENLRSLDDEVTGSGGSIVGVTVTLGGNDILAVQFDSNAERQQALSSFQNAITVAMDEIRAVVGRNMPVYLTTLYNPTSSTADQIFSDAWWIEEFNNAIRDAANSANATIVELGVDHDFGSREFTRFPIDPHPTNAGHVRIAELVWQATGLDTESPVIETAPELTVTRKTPTLHFSVSSDVDPTSISIITDNDSVESYDPVEMQMERFVVLIDASELETSLLTVNIEASDFAGNTTVAEVIINFGSSSASMIPRFSFNCQVGNWTFETSKL